MFGTNVFIHVRIQYPCIHIRLHDTMTIVTIRSVSELNNNNDMYSILFGLHIFYLNSYYDYSFFFLLFKTLENTHPLVKHFTHQHLTSKRNEHVFF